MIIEGFISFRENSEKSFKPSNRYDKIIDLKDGYLSVTEFSSTNKYYRSFFIGAEFNQKEAGSISNFKITEPASFFAFNRYLESQINPAIGTGIWYSEPNKSLYLARELFGLSPLFYIHQPNNYIAFSTSLVSLIQMDLVKENLEVDHERLVGYTSFMHDQEFNYTSNTFFKNIKSVLPGHILSITPDNTHSKPYSAYQFGPSSKYSRDEEYTDAFRKLLKESVEKTIIDKSKKLGSHLSGGLDSSSIATMVKFLQPERELDTFYYDVGNKNSRDKAFSEMISKHIGSAHHEIEQGNNDFSILQLNTSLTGHPETMLISPSFQGNLFMKAQRIGCKILLNGNDGDSIVGSGLEVLQKLFDDKEWTLLKELLKKRVDYSSLSNRYLEWDVFSDEKKYHLVQQNFIYSRLAPKMRQLKPVQFYRLYRQISKVFDIDLLYFVKSSLESLRKKMVTQVPSPQSILRNDILAEFNPVSNFALTKSFGSDTSDDIQQCLTDVYNAQAISQNEAFYALGLHYGISIRSPFYDKELFELCMSVPTLTKYGNGQGRAHFREAMKGILPDYVRTRHDKGVVGFGGRTITLRLLDQAKSFLFESEEIWKYVDKDKFLKEVQILSEDNLPAYKYNRPLFHITRTISLAVWLEWLKKQL